jgi:hypothetical protein
LKKKDGKNLSNKNLKEERLMLNKQKDKDW